MKPNFALSLSFDGIRLMYRASGGWRLVGEADVASQDLAGELAVLRKTASDLQPGRLRSKVIIPDDQIRYFSITTGRLDRDGRIEAARSALNGATPYPIDALSFDVCEDGDKTHIAAVARETLAEAEAFALEHRFNPVSFVAAPCDKPFLGEPFFGPSAYANTLLGDGETVEADGVRVVVVGKLQVPDGPVATDDALATGPVVKGKQDNGVSASEREPPKVARASGAQDAGFVSVRNLRADVSVPGPGNGSETKSSDSNNTSAIAKSVVETGQSGAVTAPGFSSRRTHGRGKRGIQPEGERRPTPTPASGANPTRDQLTFESPHAAAESLNPASGPEVTASRTALSPGGKYGPPDGSSSFLSRRKPRIVRSDPPQTSPPVKAATQAAAAIRQTPKPEFGKPAKTDGKSRNLGIILTILLVVFLAGVAAWASVFLDERLSWLFPSRERTLASTLPEDIAEELADAVGLTISMPPPTPDTGEALATLNLNPAETLTAEDAAVLDALRAPELAPTEPDESNAAAREALYAITGVWIISPKTPDTPEEISLSDMYVTGIDPVSPALDAVALPQADAFQTDDPLTIVTSPAEPGTLFARDASGRIVPTVEGALSPDGYTVFLGRPTLTPPDNLARVDSDLDPEPGLLDLTLVRPKLRPTNLVENFERASLGGLSRSELALLRPRLRPASAQELAAAAAPQASTTPSALATAVSARPRIRPSNFVQLVARAERQKQNRASTVSSTSALTASITPRIVKPAIPSSASVAREATMKNAINLRQINLIGVYGSPSDRRALVRLGNGRYQKVQVGDRFDGGRVSAIGDSELRYQKGGRNVVLKIPQG